MLRERKKSSSRKRPCCRQLRCEDSSRLSFPLARRGRPFKPTRSRQILCKTCLKIKREQESIILENDQNPSPESHSENIFQTINDLNQLSNEEVKPSMLTEDIPHEIEFSLINPQEQINFNPSEYDSSEMLVWKMNTSSSNNTIDITYDTGSLTNEEKKILLGDAVEKLQIVLRNRPTSSSLPENDFDQIEFTYRTLQTTVDILSSSLNTI